MEFDRRGFVEGVRARAGLEFEQASMAVDTTFTALGRALPAQVRRRVAAQLPAELAATLREGSEPSEPCCSAVGFLADLAAHEHVSLGFAKEHGQVVLEQLAALYDDDAARERLRDELREHVPEAADWLVVWHPPEPAHAHTPISTSGSSDRSLAGGRPGARTPLSEGAPDPGQAGSIAVTSDPHADTRLSSSHGISTERDRHTLAAGRPGSTRPISESGSDSTD